MLRKVSWLIVVVVALVVVAASSLSFYGSRCWFASLGYTSVFWTMVGAKLGTTLIFGAGGLGILMLNLWIARRLGARTRSIVIQLDPEAEPVSVSAGALSALAVLVILLVTLACAGAGYLQWEKFLKFLHAQSFETTDPVFGRDIGFYVFSLPLWLFVRKWLFWVLTLLLY